MVWSCRALTSVGAHLQQAGKPCERKCPPATASPGGIVAVEGGSLTYGIWYVTKRRGRPLDPTP